jgi:hypothetical protein
MKLDERLPKSTARSHRSWRARTAGAIGYCDPTIKDLEARAAVRMMTDAELRKLSDEYKWQDGTGTTAKQLPF